MKSFVLAITSILSAIIFILLIFVNRLEKKEIVELHYQKNDERIYLIDATWGRDQAAAISLEKSFDPYDEDEKNHKYTAYYDTDFFYKVGNDTLFIFGSYFKAPLQNIFLTPIKLIEISNVEMIELKYNYKDLGLSFFPPSRE